MKIIETHAHYNLSNFNADRKGFIMKLKDMGVEKIIIPAIDYMSNFDAHEKFADKEYNGIIYYAAGVHPKYLWDKALKAPLVWDESKDRHMRIFLNDPRTVAVGETGLDYSRCPDDRKWIQKEYFKRFIEYANEYKKPVVLHIRPYVTSDSDGNVINIDQEVFSDAIEILKTNPIENGTCMHCYHWGKDIAKQFMEVGVNYFGIGGAIGDRASQELIDMIKWVPIENLLVETDAPFQRYNSSDPYPVTSETLIRVIERIAEIKGMDSEYVCERTYENARLFYRL